MKRKQRPLSDWEGLRVRASGDVDDQTYKGSNLWVCVKNVKVATYTNSDPSAIRSIDHAWVVLDSGKELETGLRVHWLGDVIKYRRLNRTEDFAISCIRAYWLEDELEDFFKGLSTTEQLEKAIAILSAELQNLDQQTHGFPACISYHHYRQRLTNGWFKFTEMRRAIAAKESHQVGALAKVKKFRQRTA